MSNVPTPEERAILVDVASDILRATIERLTPDLVKLAEALRERPAVFLEPITSGVLEAMPAFQPRDYRKECWIAAYTAGIAGDVVNLNECERVAAVAVTDFDKAFPQ